MSDKVNSTEDLKINQIFRRLLSNASIYGLSMILLKVGNLLMLPIYWQKLNPEDFGLIALFQLLTTFLEPVYNLGIPLAVQRHFFDWPRERMPRILGSAYTFSLTSALCMSLLLTVTRNLWGPLVFANVPSDLTLHLAIWMVFFQNFSGIPMAVFRSREELGRFSILNILQFVTQSGAILFFVFVLSRGAEGYLLGLAASSLFFAVIWSFLAVREMKLNFQWSLIRPLLAFALPTTPGGILDSMNAVLDRFFLDKHTSLAEIGIYSLAKQFGSAYNLLLIILKSSWFPLIYRISSEREDRAEVLARLCVYYLILIAIPAVAAIVTSRDVILLINDPKYFGIAKYVPYFILGYFIQGIGHAFGRGIDLAKKTKYYGPLYVITLAVGIGSLYFLVPLYGVWGAVSSFILTMAVRETVQMILSYWVFPRPTYYRKIASIIGVSLVTLFVCNQIQTSWPILNLLVKLLFVIVASIAMVFLIIDRAKILNFLKSQRKSLGFF